MTTMPTWCCGSLWVRFFPACNGRGDTPQCVPSVSPWGGFSDRGIFSCARPLLPCPACVTGLLLSRSFPLPPSAGPSPSPAAFSPASPAATFSPAIHPANFPNPRFFSLWCAAKKAKFCKFSKKTFIKFLQIFFLSFPFVLAHSTNCSKTSPKLP